ncbi:hypothetical protein ACWOEH_03545 [Enterococcus nangangensis]
MLLHDDFSEVVVELAADVDELGNELIWGFYQEVAGEKKYTDYLYKPTPEASAPTPRPGEAVEEILAKELLVKMHQQLYTDRLKK